MKFEYKDIPACTIKELNVLGRQGWEVVQSYTDRFGLKSRYLLKREVVRAISEVVSRHRDMVK